MPRFSRGSSDGLAMARLAILCGTSGALCCRSRVASLWRLFVLGWLSQWLTLQAPETRCADRLRQAGKLAAEADSIFASGVLRNTGRGWMTTEALSVLRLLEFSLD